MQSPGCSVPLRRPAGEHYPANSLGIPLRFFSMPQSASAQLFNLDTGAEVPGEAVQSTFASCGYGLFVPQQPLAPGRYALAGEVQCPSSAEIWRYRVPLELEASAPVPTQLGTVQVRSFGVLPERPENGAACASPPMGATALLEVTPAPLGGAWVGLWAWKSPRLNNRGSTNI